jgi:hypothetical protein
VEEVMGVTAATGTSRVVPPGRLGLALRDHLAIILVELAGGPVPKRLILQQLRRDGWEGPDSVVSQALRRSPELFSNRGHGMYALACMREAWTAPASPRARAAATDNGKQEEAL